MSQGSSELMQASANEVTEPTCQICADGGEKEAVGFCTSCDMYICQTCSEQHKKIPVTKCHNVLGKEQFAEVHAVKGLFDKKLIPTFQVQHPALCNKLSFATKDDLKNYTECELCHILNVPNSDIMVYFVYQTNNVTKTCIYEIGTIGNTTRYMYKTRTSGDIKDISMLEKDETCFTCKDMIYITIPKTNMVIKYCCQHNDVYLAFKLPAGNLCNAITRFNDGLAVAVNVNMGFYLTSEWMIHHVQLDGTTINEFYYSVDGKLLFGSNRPVSLASNSLQDVLFVATNNRLVFALDRKGTVIFKYTYQDNPSGITCDTDGNIFIATTGKKIIQMDKHGENTRDLLRSSNNILNICFNMKSQQLVVADSTYKITYFKFV